MEHSIVDDREIWKRCLASLKDAEKILDTAGSISMYETKKTLQVLIRNVEKSIKRTEEFYEICHTKK